MGDLRRSKFSEQTETTVPDPYMHCGVPAARVSNRCVVRHDGRYQVIHVIHLMSHIRLKVLNRFVLFILGPWNGCRNIRIGGIAPFC